MIKFRSLRGTSLFALGLSLGATAPAFAQATEPAIEETADTVEILVTAQKHPESAQMATFCSAPARRSKGQMSAGRFQFPPAISAIPITVR